VIDLVSTSDPVERVAHAIRSGNDVVVADDPDALDPVLVGRLTSALAGDGVGSVSPVPAPGRERPSTYPLHDASPPAPSLALPCPILCAFSGAALSASMPDTSPARTPGELVVAVGEQLLAHGWRHVACPGVALSWDPSADPGVSPIGGWSSRSLASMTGDANTALEAHRSWATASTRSVRVVVDGACMTAQPYTGTQHLVLEVSRWLKAVRPQHQVAIAVKPAAIEHVSAALGNAGVEVVDRSTAVDADVLYRPYQMLFARELDFVLSTGRRRLVGQLDMIGFSNPFYHPSEQLFFFARNLQRHLMRVSDGVTFISRYGLESTYADVPDLDRHRLHVVSCGADPIAKAGELHPDRDLDRSTPFLVCLSSTFWHKNRAHAIATLAALVERHRYDGHIVIAGPEPYYGKSTAAEQALIDELPPEVVRRIHRWGHIDEAEKWWLLEHADAALYPSIVEGFGLIPFESAAAGTPCLAYAGTAQGELLRGTGAVVPSWDASVWADRVASWISDPTTASKVVAEIGQVAGAHTWERCARLTWDAIDAGLAAPRRAPAVEDGARLARISTAGFGSGSAAATALRFDVARGLPAARRRASKLARRISHGTTA
jgi:glycosyltransferase involved in cell wall biosynthesis